MTELTQLLTSLFQANSLISLGVLAACLVLSWALVRLLRGSTPSALPDTASVWFGDRIYDGVLFPATALVIAYAARLTLAGQVSAAVFKLAIPMLIALLVIRLMVRVLRASFPKSRWMRVVERSVSWMAWLALLLWITGVLPLLLSAMEDVRWKMGSAQVSLRDAVEALITGGLVMMLALWAAGAAERKLLRGTDGIAGGGFSNSDLSVRKMLANIVRAGLLFVGLLLTLSAVGIDLTALSVLGGAVGVGLGFGLQKIAANYVSGFVILAERSLRIGDMVKVDNFEGRITDIRTRYTVIRALNGREAIVPNEMLITQRVENSSLADPRVLLTSTVQVAYGTDVPALQGPLEAAMAAVLRVIADPAPSVQLTTFAADGMDLSLLFWIRDPENGQGNVRSEVNLAVLAVLQERGIEIPYPHRVVQTVAVPAPPDQAGGRG